MSEIKDVNYVIQFDIIRRQGDSFMQVIFHGPGRMGFTTPELAEIALAALVKNSAEGSVYEVVPVLVASDFDPHFEALSENNTVDDIEDMLSLPAIDFSSN